MSELAAPYKMSLAAAAKHVAVLESSGLLKKRREGRTVRCRLAPEPLKDAAEWISRYRRFWSDQLDALDDYLGDDA